MGKRWTGETSGKETKGSEGEREREGEKEKRLQPSRANGFWFYNSLPEYP